MIVRIATVPLVLVWIVAQASANLTFDAKTETTVSISWPKNTTLDLTDYVIKYSPTDASVAEVTIFGTTAGDITECPADSSRLCAQMNALTPGKQYDVSVIEDGSEEYTGQVRTNPAAPSWPASGIYTLNSPQVTVKWEPSAGDVKHYEVTVLTISTRVSNVFTTTDGTITQHVFDAAAGEKYHVQVRSVDADDVESTAIETSFTIKPIAVDIGSVSFDSSNLQDIKVTWTKPQNTVASEYLVTILEPTTAIIVGTTPAAATSTVDFTEASPTFSISGVKSGEKVMVKIEVESYDAKKSDPVEKEHQTKPSKVNSITFDATNPSAIKCRWSAPANTVADEYQISLTNAPSGVALSSQTLNFVAGGTAEVTLTGVKTGQIVTVQVIVRSGNVDSDPSQGTYQSKPSKVSSITFDATNPSAIKCRWNAPANTVADEYQISLTNNPSGVTLSSQTLTFVAGGTAEVTLTGVKTGQIVTVQVIVRSGNVDSDPSQGTYQSKPSKVEVSSIQFDFSDPAAVKCTWNEPANTVADRYLISLVNNPPAGVSVGPATVAFDGGTREATLSGVTSGQSVTVQVIVKSGTEQSEASQKTYHSKPTAINVNTIIIDDASPENLLIKWTKPVTTATAYSIEKSANTPLNNVQIGDFPAFSVANPEVRVTGLSPGQKVELVFKVVSGVESDPVVTSYVRAPDAVDASSIEFTPFNDNQPNYLAAWTAPTSDFDSFTLALEEPKYGSTTSVDSTTTPQVNIMNVQPGQQVTLVITVVSHGKSSNETRGVVTKQPNEVDASTIQFDAADPENIVVTWATPAGQGEMFILTGNVATATITPPEVAFDSVDAVRKATITGLKAGEEITVSIDVESGDVSSGAVQAKFRRVPSSVDVDSITFDDSNPSLVKCTWDAPANTIADRYLISLVNTASGPSVSPGTVNFVSGTREVTLSGIVPGQSVAVQVIVRSGTTQSLPSQKTYQRNPAQVSDLLVKDITNVTATVTWTAAAGVVSNYELSVTPNDGVVLTPPGTGSPAAAQYGAGVTEVQLSGLQPALDYTLSLVTKTGEKTSEPKVTDFKSRPSGVALDVKSVTESSVNVSWSESDSGSGVEVEYELFYRAVLRNPNSPQTVIKTNDTSVIIEVFPGEKYEFIIRPHVDGHVGEESTLQTTIPPLEPISLRIDKGAIQTTSVRLQWSGPPESRSYAVGYKIEYTAKDDANVKEVVYVPGRDTRSHVLGGGSIAGEKPLSTGRQYYVKLWTVTTYREQYLSSQEYEQITITARPTLTAEFSDDSKPGSTDMLRIAYTENQPYYDSTSVQIQGKNAPGTNPATVTDRTLLIGNLEAGTQYIIEYWVSSNSVRSEIKSKPFYTAPSKIADLRAEVDREKSMSLVWSPVDDLSVVSIKCTNADQYSREVQPPMSRVQFTGMEAYTAYDFEVTVIKYGKTSQMVTISQSTQESPPSAVAAFSVTRDPLNPFTHATLSWQPPAQPRGLVKSYLVVYEGSRTDRADNSLHQGEIRYGGSAGMNKVVDEFKGGRTYKITIKAVNSMGPGEAKEASLTTELGRPKLLEPSYKPTSEPTRVKQTSVGVKFKNVFDDTNGPISGYSVIVYEDDGKSKVSMDQITTWKAVQEGVVPWSAYYATEKCQIFKSKSLCEGRPTSVGERKKRSTSEEEVTFEIGIQDCTYAKTDETCNGPLLPGRTYRATLRAHTAAGDRDTQTSEAFSTASPPPNGALIGVVVALVILLIIACAVAGFLYYKYRPFKLGKKPKGPTEPPPSRPVRIQQFPNHFTFMSADADFRFCEEYERLKLVGCEQSIDEARKDYNLGKNRFANISPYDWSRIKLSMMDDVPGTDYINANYMPGHNSKREFLVCQGPLVATVDDFWRMIWEQNCTVIVMLTKLIESNGREKCTQYWPSDTNPIRYGDILVTVANETNYEHFNVMELRLQKDGRTRAVRHFFYKAWPDFGVPPDPESILKFITFIRKKVGKAQPICVHCSAGVGRSGTYICLDKLIQDMEAGQEFVDIFGTVHEMRRHRCLMVQTEQQYIFIHRAIKDIVEGAVRIDSLQPICNTNPAFNEEDMHTVDLPYYDCYGEDGKWPDTPPDDYRLILEDEGVQLEIMA